MASELELNRMLSKVQTHNLALLIYGGQVRLNSLRRTWSKIENDPEFSKSDRPFKNHSERYVDACRKIKRFQEVAEEENFQSLDEVYDAYMAIDENLPIDVHLSMFIPIMTMHTSSEQKERWLSASQSFRMIGAYAQTELAHGSNVRGIETSATYDVTTDEFIINTPSLTSAKWWPGGLGHTATHAVVYANLLLKGRNYGPHPFMVQLRSLVDHRPLPRIILGDLGPKQGYNSMDNGFALFDRVRIPRTDMLMGFAQVSSAGEYSKQEGAEKIAFGIMLDVRARICMNSAYVMARALTISIRYSCVRVQGFVDNSGRSPQERAVIDYPTQQRVLMPLLSLAYALHFTGVDVKRFYTAYTRSGDSSLLSELHASSAGLKAYITAHVSEGMESCRKMCGGHGFLVNAGFSDLYTSYLPFSTLEGTKEVLQQQMGRFLLKQHSIAHSTGKKRPPFMAPSTLYLLEEAQYTQTHSRGRARSVDLQSILTLLEGGADSFTVEEYTEAEEAILMAHSMRSSWCIAASAAAVGKWTKILKQQDSGIREGTKTLDSVNGRGTAAQDPLLIASVELCTAAEAHSELLILQSFSRGIRSQSLSSSSSSGDKGRQREGSEEEAEGESAVYLEASEVHALRLMLLLLGVSMLGRSSGQFLAAGAIRIEDFPVIGESLILLLLLLLLLLHSPSLLSLLPPLLLLLV
jgi:alkylation response protein AidB-like acyl-CoA dehydrogenase